MFYEMVLSQTKFTTMILRCYTVVGCQGVSIQLLVFWVVARVFHCFGIAMSLHNV